MSSFDAFLGRLLADADDYAAGRALAQGVVPELRRHFALDEAADDHLVAGSFGKRTAIRPLPPVDLYFLVPADPRADPHSAREDVAIALDLGPSALADGWRVTLPLPGGLLAVVPALRQGGAFLIPDPLAGGWRLSNPAAEIAAFHLADQVQGGRLLRLLALVKAWVRQAGVPLGSFAAEVLTREFVTDTAPSQPLPALFRGFLTWTLGRLPADLLLPGGLARLVVDDAWRPAAEAAVQRCLLAEYHGAAGNSAAALAEWRLVFGHDLAAMDPPAPARLSWRRTPREEDGA